MYYAKQVSPEWQSDPLFYTHKNKQGRYELGMNDDYYNENVIIYGNNEYHYLTTKEFDKIIKLYDNYYDYNHLESCGFKNVSEFLNFYLTKSNGKKYSPKEVKEWKELLDNWSGDIEDIAEKALELMTNTTWRKVSIRGYMQREWQTMYVNSLINEKDVDYIGMCYFNTGSEFLVYESEEDYENEENSYSIYLDCDSKEDVANQIGCEVNDLKVFKYVGYHKVSDYEEM